SGAGKCEQNYTQPTCYPTPISAKECDGTVHQGAPLFVHDWCACKDGGVKQGGECKGYTDSCTSEQGCCSVGKVCTRNETAGEDFHCECPPGTCLYPFDDCDKHAFVTGDVDKNLGECATLRCSIDSLKLAVPFNCQVTTYANTAAEIDMRLGTTDVICMHEFAGEQIETRHSVGCVNGQWEGVEFNKQCNATKGLIYSYEQFDPFVTTRVSYSFLPGQYMSIRCNGNGEWMGLVPTEKCVNGQLKAESDLARCICNDGYFGVDCSSPCDQGTPKGDGTCDCFDGFHGVHCEIEEKCVDNQPNLEMNGDNINMVFIIDLYQAGFDQFITDKQTGLINSVQQLIRDISYYDGQFVGNFTLITFGT
ncbi:hypothetical protein PMAYCL1PPCAC_11603, partial [Pristionchus mayeri]